MRTAIVAWSTLSGVILGLFVDATLIGVAFLLGALLPGIATRLNHRWIVVAAIVALALVPVVAGLLGFAEGRLKAR